jgi:hypothetical protein
MRGFKYKKLLIIGVIIGTIMITELVGVLPYIMARTVSSIYSIINYPERKLKFQRCEYAYGFGDYSVVYKDKDENTVGFMLTPKEFPIFIVWDSIRQDGFDD